MDTRLRPVRHDNQRHAGRGEGGRTERRSKGGSFSKIVQTHQSTGGFYVSVKRTIRVNKTRDAQKPEAGQRRNIIRLVYLLCYLQ